MAGNRYSVIGLGKLGASMVAALASRGFDVIGVDVSQKAVDLLNAGQAPVQETALAETIARHRERLRATISCAEAVLNSDVSFVVVPTPSDTRGSFSIEYAAAAFREIGRALAQKAGYHLVVLTSTVLPGATRHGLLPILECESGKLAGPDFGLCYSPEFIALGSVIQDFLNPDFTLIGESDERAGSRLEICYSEILLNGAPCRRMSIENAELAKIALNAYVTTKISFANMLSELCERLPGGDVDVVTGALGLDKRIGLRYLTGGLGYGGPCFPRDNAALAFVARSLGGRAELSETTDRFNRGLPGKYSEQIRALARTGDTVAILGLAYKPLTHVVEESQGLELALLLAQAGLRVIAFDPWLQPATRAALASEVVVLDSLADALSEATIVVITTPDPAFRQLAADAIPKRALPTPVIDFWRVARLQLAGQPHIRYLAVGTSSSDDENAARLEALWGQHR
jgi:UDPglucose 6-dehydrogenase